MNGNDWNTLRDHMANGMSVPTSVTAANLRRGKVAGGRRLAVTSPIKTVAAAMSVCASFNEGFQEAKIGRDSYIIISKLLMMKRRLPQYQTEIDEFCAKIDATKFIGADVHEFVEKHWSKEFQRKNKPEGIVKRQRRLDQTLLSISETCEAMRDMRLPQNLSADAKQEAIVTLINSMELITQLMRQLLGEKS